MKVAEYYDRNTGKFLRNRKNQYRGAIHRKLYPPGVKSSHEAEFYTNQLLLEIIKKEKSNRILDLGCGVGGTIRYLGERFTADYKGITISPVQVDMAVCFNTAVELADFQDTVWFENSGSFDAIYALESLQHNPDHDKLARNLRLISRTGSTFIVIDDFLISPDKLSEKTEKLKIKFMKHWHACGFTDVENFISIFEKNGFQLLEKQDLTGYMKKKSVLTLLINLISLVLLVIPCSSSYIDNIIGGSALKQLQRLGCSGYYKIVFKAGGIENQAH